MTMHCFMLPTVRNGIAMMKFALNHSDQFNSPACAFFLGAMVAVITMIAGIINSMYYSNVTKVIDIIRRFVKFKLLVQVQDYYVRTRANDVPQLKSIVGKYPLIIKERMNLFSEEKNINKNLLILLYVIYQVIFNFYSAIYFYFLPFLIIIIGPI